MNHADMTPWSVAAGSSETVATPQGPDDPTLDDEASPPEATAVAARRRRRRWIIGIAAALVVGALLGVFFVPTPYVLLEPGSVRSTRDRIELTGRPTFDSSSDVLFTTVLVDRATVAGLLRGTLDDAVEVHTQEEIYGPRGRDETQRLNRRQMDLSKLVATIEALELLGLPAELTAEGARVIDVVPGSGSEGALRAGDVIVAVDGATVALPSDLRDALGGRLPGDEVRVSVRRPEVAAGETASGGERAEPIEVPVVLGAANDDEEDRAVLGVSVEPESPAVASEVDVQIDSGTVSGPSAGLAWSLGIVDLLTPGDLAGGDDVAVTGEMLSDGTVGPIGGLVQKTATVKRNGVQTFIYPSATPDDVEDEMRRIAGDELELVAVDTLAEAVEHLDESALQLPDAAGD